MDNDSTYKFQMVLLLLYLKHCSYCIHQLQYTNIYHMHYKTEGVPLGFAICLSKHCELSGLGNKDFLLLYSLKNDGCISRKCHSLCFLFIYSHVLTWAKSSICGSWPTWGSFLCSSVPVHLFDIYKLIFISVGCLQTATEVVSLWSKTATIVVRC